MTNFWDSNVWGPILLFGIVLASLFGGNILKKAFPFLKRSLIPTSVIGGTILIVIAAIYKAITGNVMFDTAVFAYKGTEYLEIITYHSLAIGFIASALTTNDKKMSKQRTTEIFNTGVTTVATYLIQGIVGMGITIIAALCLGEFYKAAGLLLPFGFGQGTGQAMNYGNIYEVDGFIGGKSFGLTIAALGFLTAAFGGVIHLNVLKRRGKLHLSNHTHRVSADEVEGENEPPMQDSVDKMSIQMAFVFGTYGLAYLVMMLLGNLLPGMKATIYGFNFLLGVLMATLVKAMLKLFRKIKWVRRNHTNNFLLTRISNFFFDLMIITGIAAIRLDVLEDYWGIAIILAVAGFIVTYVYNRIVAKALFKHYQEEQFMAMYGMLTGTASTGIILLREIDEDFKTPAADNLVYQNFPAIAFGFPLMLIATFAPKQPYIALAILAGMFIVLNIILFRSFIFKRRKKK